MPLSSEGIWRTETGHELPYVTDTTGTPRILGAHLNVDRTYSGLPKFAAVRAGMPRFDRQDWADAIDAANGIDYSHFEAPVLDQGQHGSCVGHGGCTGFTRCWDMRGNGFQAFSPCYLYSLINGGRDGGAVVSDAMAALLTNGICLETTVPEGRIFRGQYDTARADAEAGRFQLAEAYHCETYDDLVAALVYGYTVVYGIMVGGSFGNLDAGGVAPVGGTGGHCMTGYGLRWVAAGRYKGQLAVRNQNSWSTDWGLQGTCLLVEDHFQYAARWGMVDAFACTAPVPDDDPARVLPDPLS